MDPPASPTSSRSRKQQRKGRGLIHTSGEEKEEVNLPSSARRGGELFTQQLMEGWKGRGGDGFTCQRGHRDGRLQVEDV